MNREAMESENLYGSSEAFAWPSQTYSSIIHDLDISEAEPHTSTNTTPTNSETTAALFTARYDIRRLDARESRVCEVDLRALDYVESPNESLVCTICAAPFIIPMELGCEHIFCEDCIYEHLSCGIQSASSCPKCRRHVASLKPVPKLLNQLLDELEAECPNKSAGCLQPLKRYTVNDHVNKYCDYEELRCPKSNCSGQIQRRFLGKGCLHTHIECEVCNDLIMEKDLADHEENTCPGALVDCDYCHIELRRGRIQNHINIECPMVTTKCSGHVVGCVFEDRRTNVDNHVTSCPMAMMSSYFTTLNDKQTSLQEENRRLRNQVEGLHARIDELEDHHKKLAQSIKKERRKSVMAETSAASASRIEELQARMDELTADWNTRLDNATSEAARIHMEMMNTAQQNGQRFYTINGTLTQLRSQLSHLLTSSRPTGSSAGSASAGAGGLASGASAGGGVSLDTARREPPKL